MGRREKAKIRRRQRQKVGGAYGNRPSLAQRNFFVPSACSLFFIPGHIYSSPPLLTWLHEPDVQNLLDLRVVGCDVEDDLLGRADLGRAAAATGGGAVGAGDSPGGGRGGSRAVGGLQNDQMRM